MPPSHRKVSILIFHMAGHFLGNNTASVLHTASIISCSPRPHAPASPAVIVPSHPRLCWPAEATRAARASPWGREPSRAAAEPGQPGFPWRHRCQGLQQRAFGSLCADGPRPGSGVSSTPAVHHSLGLAHCTAHNTRAGKQIIDWENRIKKILLLPQCTHVNATNPVSGTP